MFRVFRTVRNSTLSDNRTGRYWTYALGELVLIIAGILVALQISNWNEARLEQKQITEYAYALIQDLERDLAMAEVISSELSLILTKIDTLADYTRGKSIDQIRNIDLFYLMRRPFYRPFAWNRTALEQIKNSGALRQMKDQVLAAKIAEYEALTHHLDDDFEFDRTQGTSAVAMAKQVVDMNYPDLESVVPVGREEVFSFPDSDIHAAYREYDLPLLTNDMAEVRRVVNAYLVLAEKPGLRPRAKLEMSKLNRAASELLDLLRKEYPGTSD